MEAYARVGFGAEERDCVVGRKVGLNEVKTETEIVGRGMCSSGLAVSFRVNVVDAIEKWLKLIVMDSY